MKILLALLGNVFTSYLLIEGLKRPAMIGFVKNSNGSFIQPDTIMLQIVGWTLILICYLIITAYLILKFNQPDKK